LSLHERPAFEGRILGQGGCDHRHWEEDEDSECGRTVRPEDGDVEASRRWVSWEDGLVGFLLRQNLINQGGPILKLSDLYSPTFHTHTYIVFPYLLFPRSHALAGPRRTACVMLIAKGQKICNGRLRWFPLLIGTKFTGTGRTLGKVPSYLHSCSPALGYKRSVFIWFWLYGKLNWGLFWELYGWVGRPLVRRKMGKGNGGMSNVIVCAVGS